jgi:hypothetical protein
MEEEEKDMSFSGRKRHYTTYKDIFFPRFARHVTGESKAALLVPPNLPSPDCDNQKFSLS